MVQRSNIKAVRKVNQHEYVLTLMHKTKLWKSKLFWKTYTLNITLLCTILGALLLIAYIVLPDISQDKSKEITDQAAKGVQDQLSIIIETLSKKDKGLNKFTRYRVCVKA
jgi:glutamate/tyrosine decarboxylase-like PLP-dependent enzyme